MEPIINPWIFYGLQMVTTATLLCVFVGLCLFAAGIYKKVEVDDSYYLHGGSIIAQLEAVRDALNRWTKKGYILTISDTTNLEERISKKDCEYIKDVFKKFEEEESKKGSHYLKSLQSKIDIVNENLNDIEKKIKGDAASKGFSWQMCIGAILVILGLIIPSQDTLKKMLIAHYATTNNINLLKEDAKASIDYLFEKIQQAVEKGSKK